ncbi:class I SAM-dependent methyltransferase [Acetobacter peroxydans]|uniref:class I SAM-dependent methyltransferase n=1 Tax=Acetobacter peroxydans TaxID=104098 RepID=UPI0023541682|nr:methyltransferase domain-containing protein [Acetobacter peroxydans]MCH4142564.1 methyltransferase domain-containing protein [Acetobacter peroxydans]MCI1393890.1 methyltransferase domain-containing protein [Acetobacter peroxydans]MCI1410444.1 methyltransferase domain-containing protein [Acetobacter peroxydans]MCI1439888.1 methyltransferase domain-containing protein [Acetobacter peroxydans]MCI1565655.1 methyltransferase domain-containing protein [Acetobacter peroxydans]
MNDTSCPPVTPQEAPCPVCGNAHAAFAFPAYGYDLNRYDLFRCSTCALVFVSPFPSAETLRAFYRTNYRQASATFYPKASSRRRRAVWRSLAFLPQVVGKDVLEIGCGGGFMVEAFKRLGARVIGLDISQNSIDYARAHFGHCTFYCETMQEFRQRGLQFDFVFTSEVMEHLPGPTDFMQTLEAVVRPGGFVYASAPDYSHPRAPSDLILWDAMCPPEHLLFFSSDTLIRLFTDHGFTLYRNFGSKTPAHSMLFRRSA